jgi:nitrogen fixation protein
MIPTRVHGIMDYAMGLLLIAAPWLFGFSDIPAATWVPVVLGAGVIVYSLITNYELAAVRLLPMRIHLLLDMAGGVLLLASPWLFNFADEVRWPHVVFGALEIGAAAMTARMPGRDLEDRAHAGRHAHA